MLAALSRKHIASAAGLVNWSRTQAVPADCLCLRKAMGLWPMAGPALGRNTQGSGRQISCSGARNT